MLSNVGDKRPYSGTQKQRNTQRPDIYILYYNINKIKQVTKAFIMKIEGNMTNMYIVRSSGEFET